jgi:hypothetical protein
MAPSKLDFVRSILAEWERGDYSSAAWADAEHEYVIVGGPSPGSWTGLPAMAQAWREFLSAWDEWWTKAEEYRELDHERVLVLIRSGGRGKTSGLEIPQGLDPRSDPVPCPRRKGHQACGLHRT